MSFSPFQQYPCTTLAIVSFLVNIPLGYLRENYPRFSFTWFFWIHASIPFIVYLRVASGISFWVIPFTVFMAVCGQVWGGCIRRKRMSPEDVKRLKQIPSIYLKPKEKIDPSEAAVVLLNMGGPRTNREVKDFQKRLFSDPILIRFPLSFLFQRLFARLLILFRGNAARKRYQLIGGGSPSYNSTEKQRKALQEELKGRGHVMDVLFSFNYSSPLPEETIREVKGLGKKRILPLSLYPHYSKATTGSSIHYLKKAARRSYPELNFLDVPEYYLREGYIQAFVDRVHEQIKQGETLDDFYLVFSAHSLPLYLLAEGDPYPFQVAQTVAQILSGLDRTDRWVISYQSAVGPLRWLKPSTEDMIESLIAKGFKNLLIIPISFVTDHIETLCEIDIEYRQFAQQLGVADFRMSKAIESHPGFIGALADSVESALGPAKETKHDITQQDR